MWSPSGCNRPGWVTDSRAHDHHESDAASRAARHRGNGSRADRGVRHGRAHPAGRQAAPPPRGAVPRRPASLRRTHGLGGGVARHRGHRCRPRALLASDGPARATAGHLGPDPAGTSSRRRSGPALRHDGHRPLEPLRSPAAPAPSHELQHPDALPDAGRAALLLARCTPPTDLLPEIELRVARAGGAWEPFGRIHLATGQIATDPTISFDPIEHTVPGLSVYPWTARMREGAYAAARSSRSG